MKHVILAALSFSAIASIAVCADPPPKKAATPAKKSPPVAAAKKGATPSATRPNTAAKSKAPAQRYYGRQTVRRTYAPQQISPSADRFREIQDALAAKGYLKTPSTGVWDKDSMDAMQRFQQDQKLEATGKLTAKSLVALGLGPKTPAVSSTPAPNPSANPSGSASPSQKQQY